jgi:alkanesulfonate monooxygenase SsuD/methylene tetrahydromethanopterin reductase-like flavin-dependent oxidoreductase (luciferase family)
VQVGVLLDMRNPPPWHRPWSEFYADALRQVEEAERLGIDSIWLTEHHFFEDGYLPQPLTMASAIAGRTRRIRIGTAVLIAGLRRALEIAEQAALVDIISDGRMVLGLGAGYRVAEFAAFGEDARRRYALLESRAAEVQRLWEDGGFTPGPVQVRAPLWIGAHGPRGARLAGRLGAGLLSFNPEARTAYLEALESAGHGRGAGRLTGLANLIVADDPESAWAQVAPHLGYQWSTYARYAAEGPVTGARPTATVLEELDEAVDPSSLRSAGPEMIQPRFDVVTASEAVRRLKAWLGALPVDTVYFWASICGMPSTLSQRHMELLAGVVAPALRA